MKSAAAQSIDQSPSYDDGLFFPRDAERAIYIETDIDWISLLKRGRESSWKKKCKNNDFYKVFLAWHDLFAVKTVNS